MHVLKAKDFFRFKQLKKKKEKIDFVASFFLWNKKNEKPV